MSGRPRVAPIRLPMVPEPILTAEERAQLLEAFSDPEFWAEFEKLPEPEEDEAA